MQHRSFTMLFLSAIAFGGCKSKPNDAPAADPSAKPAEAAKPTPAPDPAAPAAPTAAAPTAAVSFAKITSDAEFQSGYATLHERAIKLINDNIKDCDKLAAALRAETEATRPARVELRRYGLAHPDAEKALEAKADADQKDMQTRAPLDACKDSKAVIDAIAAPSMPEEVDKLDAALKTP